MKPICASTVNKTNIFINKHFVFINITNIPKYYVFYYLTRINTLMSIFVTDFLSCVTSITRRQIHSQLVLFPFAETNVFKIVCNRSIPKRTRTYDKDITYYILFAFFLYRLCYKRGNGKNEHLVCVSIS